MLSLVMIDPVTGGLSDTCDVVLILKKARGETTDFLSFVSQSMKLSFWCKEAESDESEVDFALLRLTSALCVPTLAGNKLSRQDVEVFFEVSCDSG